MSGTSESILKMPPVAFHRLGFLFEIPELQNRFGNFNERSSKRIEESDFFPKPRKTSTNI